MITNCTEIKKPIMDDISKSQLWNCLNGNKILDSCKYQITATDMVAASLDYMERIEMLVDYIEASVELYPTCRAVVFETSKKMLMREDIINCNIPKEIRFIHI